MNPIWGGGMEAYTPFWKVYIPDTHLLACLATRYGTELRPGQTPPTRILNLEQVTQRSRGCGEFFLGAVAKLLWISMRVEPMQGPGSSAHGVRAVGTRVWGPVEEATGIPLVEVCSGILAMFRTAHSLQCPPILEAWFASLPYNW